MVQTEKPHVWNCGAEDWPPQIATGRLVQWQHCSHESHARTKGHLAQRCTKEMRRSTRRLKDEWFQKRKEIIRLYQRAVWSIRKRVRPSQLQRRHHPADRTRRENAALERTFLWTPQSTLWGRHHSPGELRAISSPRRTKCTTKSEGRQRCHLKPTKRQVSRRGRTSWRDFGDCKLQEQLHLLILLIWKTETTPKQFRYAEIVTIFKNKGSKADCSNYRGVSLLSVVGKILTKILQISNHEDCHRQNHLRVTVWLPQC